MIPSEFTIPFSEFFQLWYAFATTVCIVSIPLCVIMLFDWQDNNKKLLGKYFKNYFKDSEGSKIDPVGCFFLLFFVPPLLFYHGKLIFNGKIDPLFLAIHIFGFLAAEGLLVIAENKFKKYGPSPEIPENEPFKTDKFDSYYSKSESTPGPDFEPDFDFTEKDASYTQYGFDPSRFKSKRHKERYEKYSNMANDENASASERQTAMRKMIEMDEEN